MANWKHRIKIKHFLSNKEDYDTCKEFSQNVYNTLKNDHHFEDFDYLCDFDRFPHKNSRYWDDESPVEYINNLLELLYDYCDANLIWVE